MKTSNLKRFMASLLAVVMLFSVVGISPAVFADDAATPVLKEDAGAVEVIIKDGVDVRDALAKALLANYDELTAEQIAAIDWQYECKGYVKADAAHVGGKTAWGTINGFEVTEKVLFTSTTYYYAALTAQNDGDSFKIRMGPNGEERTITKVNKYTGKIELNDTIPAVKIPYNEDISIDFATLYQRVFDAAVNASACTPVLTRDDVTIEYCFIDAGAFGKDWVSLEGGTVAPAVKEGTYEIRFSLTGNDTYGNAEKTCNITFEGRDAAPFQILVPEGSIGIKYANATDIDYAATETAIRNALVQALDENIPADEVKVEYLAGLGEFKPIDYKAALDKNKFGVGTQTIKLTWAGNAQYKPLEETVENVDFTDGRIATSIVYKDGAQITYNMEASVMEEAIINSVIDYSASTLPENVSGSDLTVEYYGSYIDVFSKEHNAWVSIAGGKDGIYNYPQMGAGEQQIRVSFNGNADYRPCGAVEYTLTVNKANVTVTINNPIKIMYAGEPIDASEYVSTDPADPALDVYIVYVGVNTNKQTTVYLQLTGNKEDFVNGINALLKYFDLPTLNDGMTVGEFKAAVNGALSKVDGKVTEALVNWALKDYGITYKDLKGLMDALNNITIADDLLFAIGAPAHAGQYFATAIAVNDNYNTGTSMPGSVTVLKNWKGIKLAKNPILDSNNNTITVSQAEELAKDNDLCILTKDGVALDSTSAGSVHYWFTGVGKIYAKSTMPTAPGKYIVTATVRGGDFFALPKTFTFTIVADPTPEVTPEA